MKTISRIIPVVSLALMIYRYWGAFTNDGNKVYDEMDGFFPFFLMIAGVVLFIVFLILVVLMRRKSKNNAACLLDLKKEYRLASIRGTVIEL